MKRLLQSGFAVGILIVVLLLLVINTFQLHNLEAQVADLRASGVPAGGGSTATAPRAPSAAAVPTSGVCYASPEDEAALKDPENLLSPFTYPDGWPGTVARGGTLRRLVGSDPPGMNYIASNNAADLSELYRYMTGAVAYQSPHDPDQWYPDLATKVTRSADGLVYDVHLRKGVYWHPPAVDLTDPRHAWMKGRHEVTADDFKFTLELIQNPQVTGRAASYRTYFEPWDRIEVVDPHHFRVHFKENLYINRGVLLDLPPMPRWLYMRDEDGNEFDPATWGEKQNDHWYNQRGIGAGMYVFEAWEPGVRLSFVANPDYHLAACLPPAFDRLEILVLKDQQAWLRYLKTGQLDYSIMQPQQYLAEVKDRLPYLGEEKLKLMTHGEAGYFYFGWNQTRPFFQDKRVRRAMTMALDRATLVENVFAGLGEVTSGPFDQQNPCYDDRIQPWPYDLKAAAALLDEAGWVDGDKDGIREKVIDGKKVPFEFSMVLYGGSTEYETLARVYREALLSIGVKMTAEPLEWAAQLKRLDERNFDAYSGAWVPGWEVDLMQLWHSSEADKPGSSNYVSFRNPEGDRIAEALRREFDRGKRQELCHAFHALVHEEQPYTFFYQRKRALLYWDHLNDPVISKINPYRDARLLSFASPRQ